MSNWFENVFAPVQSRFLLLFCFYRTESALLGHFRLSQEMDNQAKIFAVVSKKKDELVEFEFLVPQVYQIKKLILKINLFKKFKKSLIVKYY